MPQSRGRKPKRQPKGHHRIRAKTRAAGPVPLLIPDSITDAELSTVQLIAAKMGMVPRQPSCSGPLLVHLDGAFECHGPDCPGGLAVFHSDDVLDPCTRHPQIRTWHACPRCLTHSDNAVLAEHTCTGQQIEHDDGTYDCTAGERCLGPDELHMSSITCRLLGPCTKACPPTGFGDA